VDSLRRRHFGEAGADAQRRTSYLYDEVGCDEIPGRSTREDADEHDGEHTHFTRA